MILERRAAHFVGTVAVCHAGMSPETACKTFGFPSRSRKAVKRTRLRDRHHRITEHFVLEETLKIM